jgi:hypothetical protein
MWQGFRESLTHATHRNTVADGTEQTYRLTERAAEDAGKETEDTAKKSSHAIVYYSEEAGHKVAHFFKTN